MTGLDINLLHPNELKDHADSLARLLADTVNAGAAIGFVQPFGPGNGMAFLGEKVFPEVKAGRRLLFVARTAELTGDGELAGTVQLDIGLPPNQPHRCEVAKMMVHPKARRKGIGLGLMQAVEAEARRLGKRLITLDTRSGDMAEPLYRKAGFRTAGLIPGFALDPDGLALHATTYMYKQL